MNQLGERLKIAVDAFADRLRAEVGAFMKADLATIRQHIASTDTARRRLLLDADVAESVAGVGTPAQTFLGQWRELRGMLQEAARLRLGQEEPQVKMHVELTGQVQSGKILTLEIEVQRVVDALAKCGAICNLPNGRHVLIRQPSPDRPER